MGPTTRYEPTGDLRVMTAEPEMRHLGEMLRSMVRDTRDSWSMARAMLRRNLAAQYRRTALGLLLAFCPALVTAAWSTLVQHARIINVESLSVPYPAFVLLSMMLWMTFLEALHGPIEALGRELHTLSRTRIPAESIILAKLGEVGFNFGVKLLLIVAAVLWFRLPVSWAACFAPLSLVGLIALGTGLGLILAPLNVLYQDISKSLGAITTFWFFLTPVLFPIPEDGIAALVMRLNPVTPLLSTTRELIALGQVNDPLGFGIASVLALAVMAIGWIFFRASLPVIIDRTNA